MTLQVVELLKLYALVVGVYKEKGMYLDIKKCISTTLLLILMGGCNGSDSDKNSGILSNDEATVPNSEVSYKYKLNTKVSNDSIRLFWSFHKDIEYYILTIQQNSEEVNSIELSKNEHSYIDYNVEEKVLYRYELYAYNKAGTLISKSGVNARINELKSLHSDEAI